MQRALSKFIALWTLLCLIVVQMVAPAMAAETVVYIHNDVGGSPIAATDANGNVLWQENYRPYGERLNNEPTATDNHQWFHGKPQDVSGLQYFGARYYDPTLGRFMGVDPQPFSEDNVHSFNRYAYGNDNPYRYVDPDGNSPIDIGFLLWDVGKFGMAVYQGSGVLAAAIDVGISIVGVAVPIPGAGLAIKAGRGARAAKAAERATEAGQAAKGGRADFIVSRDGAVMHSSPAEVRESLENAGLAGTRITNRGGTEVGTLHNVPGLRMDIRVMNGGPRHPARVVTTREGSNQPVNPANGFNLNVPRNQERERSHILFP